ncbi:MAG: helix-turn-helix transcriptional regulator [Burkholderiales bacterium]|nr:helix-turn-helix transcriptional regulator [Burkholderiales bacterium]
MSQIEIRPAWMFRDTVSGRHLDPRLFVLLEAIHECGKLTLAARRAGLSYRHAWNTIGRWSDFFGTPLVLMEKGRGAKLAPLGEKLLWAQARARARLSPQLENLASELNLEIKRALAQGSAVLRLHASYGYAVAELPDLLREQPDIELDLQYLPAADALASLTRGDCDLAGIHVPEGTLGTRALELYGQWIDRRVYRLVYLVRRQQGLFLQPGNPRRIRGLADLRRVRFVNRNRGSGTRLLLDTLLEQSDIDPGSIDGYANEEYTHAAVAAYVASGMADAGMGVEPPARQFKLDFLPLAAERYFLVARNETFDFPAVHALLAQLRGPEFRARVARLPGYSAERSGETTSMEAAFPWLAARRRRRAP